MREETDVGGKWLSGGSFEGGKIWEKGGKECKRVRLACALFVDDTVIVRISG